MREPRPSCRRVDINGIPELMGREHADYLLICGDIAIIVEEAEKVKHRDLKQIVSTYKLLKEGLVPGISATGEAIGVLHRQRSVDPMVHKLRAAQSRQHRIPIIIATCTRGLQNRVNRIIRERSRQ